MAVQNNTAAIAEQLVKQTRANGVDLDGLLGQLAKQVLGAGLEVEMDEQLGYENGSSQRSGEMGLIGRVHQRV